MQLHDDTICRFLSSCDKAGIKNPAAFLASKRHMVYDWLKGCFPYGILPTDIDGLVHLNGRFLMLEFKDEGILRDGIIPKGQLRCIRNLAASGLFTVFLIGLDQNEQPACMEVFHANGKREILQSADRETIQHKCKAWVEWIQKLPNREQFVSENQTNLRHER